MRNIFKKKKKSVPFNDHNMNLWHLKERLKELDHGLKPFFAEYPIKNGLTKQMLEKHTEILVSLQKRYDELHEEYTNGILTKEDTDSVHKSRHRMWEIFMFPFSKYYMSMYDFSNQFLDEKAFRLYTDINKEYFNLSMEKSQLINHYMDTPVFMEYLDKLKNIKKHEEDIIQ